MVLHYKYGIGDEVRLVRKPSNHSSIYLSMYSCSNTVPNTSFKINGWGWTQKEPGVFEQYYRLETDTTNGLRYLKYDNKILENEIEPVGEIHPFDDDYLIYKSANGDELEIGTKAYSSIYYGGENIFYINPDFTFTKYGRITAIRKFCDDFNCIERRIDLCYDIDKKYNQETKCYELCNCDETSMTTSEFPYLMLTNLKSNFSNDFVEALFSKKDSRVLVDKKHRNYYLVHAWLEHMGILNEVMQLYNKRKHIKKETKKKTSNKNSLKKDDKLLKILENLSEEDKKKLRDLI